jgi:CIC family chloride channel protein
MGESIEQPNVPISWRYTGGSPGFWVLVVLTGVAAGLGAIVLMALLHFIQHTAYGYSSGPFQQGVEHAPAMRPLVVMSTAGVVMAASWYALRRFGKGVHGLSESVWEHAGKLPFVTTVINAILQMVAVGFGATLGREGAPKEAGAAIASKLGDLFSLSDDQRRVLVACGAGAGMAAVYNVPLGGALFGAEVLLGTLSLSEVAPAVACSGIATAVSWLGLPDRPTYVLPALHVDAGLVLWALAFAPIAGIATALYVKSISWGKERLGNSTVRSACLVAVFAATGALALRWPGILGNGKDITQLAFVGSMSVGLATVLLVLRPLATSAFLRAGAIGGLFTPTLTLGVLLGRLCGHAWHGLAIGHEPVPAYAAIGGATLLAGAMQAPVAAVVLVLELTGTGISLAVPILLALTGSMLVARAIDDRSIYTVSRHAVPRRYTTWLFATHRGDEQHQLGIEGAEEPEEEEPQK